MIPFDLDNETWLAPYAAKRNVDLPGFIIDGIELYRFNEFADADDHRYQEIGAVDIQGANSVRYFTNPLGNKWFVAIQQDNVTGIPIAATDVHVYKLARKVVFAGLQTGSIPRMPTGDLTNQGHRIWFGYGWVDYDPSAGFGQVHQLPTPLRPLPGDNNAILEEGLNERGESIAIWFGLSPETGSLSYLTAHYDANGWLVKADDYVGSTISFGNWGAWQRTPDGLRWVKLIGGLSGAVALAIINQ